MRLTRLTASSSTLVLCITAILLVAGCRSERRGGGLPSTLPTSDAGSMTGGMSSGVPPSLSLGSLTDGQRTQLCVWGIDIQGGPERRVECSDGLSVTTGTVAGCEEGLASGVGMCASLSVGTIETCLRALASSPCNIFESESCAPLRACGMSDDI